MNFRQRNQSKFLPKCFTIFGLALLNSILVSPSSHAAEEIDFIYSPLIQSLEVRSLEIFAEEGQITPDLKFYLDFVDANPEQKQLLKETLTRKIDIDPVLLSRILRTDEGERLLNSFGEIVQIRGGRNAKFALRGAIVRSAFEEEGLTLLNVLQNIQVNIQVDLETLLYFANNLTSIIEGTEQFVNEVKELSQKEAKKNQFVNYQKQPDLRQSKATEIKTETWFLEDATRNRKFYALVYYPQELVGEKIPVVIISHGLASEVESKSKLAKHLASYGFFVILPQHIGSDREHLQGFIEGYNQQVSDLNEFIDRPLDITFTLDELERRNGTDFAGRLDMDNVGIYGHSYGGYTAFAVAGASPVPNYAQLNSDCDAVWGIFNNALLLQCRALQLQPQVYNFRDERIRAVMAENPVNASIFGEEGLNNLRLPTAVIAGSYDPATPFIFEQVRSFPWINAPEKYLMLEEGQAHVDISTLDLGISRLLDRIPSLNLPSPELLNNYSEAIAVAFFQVYVAKNEQYRPYLNPAYTAYLSEGQEFKALMITQESVAELEEEINRYIEDLKLGDRPASDQ